MGVNKTAGGSAGRGVEVGVAVGVKVGEGLGEGVAVDGKAGVGVADGESNAALPCATGVAWASEVGGR